VTVVATRRLTLREAAEVLGVSKEAVRKRALRGSLRSERGADGRVYVYVDDVHDEPPTHEPAALISQLRDEVAYLRDENRRKDEIIMQQALTVRQLTAAPSQESPEPPGGPETATEQPGRVEPQPTVESAQEPRESSEMHMPEVGGGPLPRDQQRPSERRWWEFWR
jgi:hypothetical protein